MTRPGRIHLFAALVIFTFALRISLGQTTNSSLRIASDNPNGMFNQMEMCVATQNRWYRLEPLPTATHGVTGAACVNGFIHAPGGGTSTGGSSGSLIHQVFWVGGICA